MGREWVNIGVLFSSSFSLFSIFLIEFDSDPPLFFLFSYTFDSDGQTIGQYVGVFFFFFFIVFSFVVGNDKCPLFFYSLLYS